MAVHRDHAGSGKGDGGHVTVYVDDMMAQFGLMKMCHMVADTDEELHAMAAKIGVARRWHQKPGTHKSHYDIAMSKRALARQAGAVDVTWRQLGAMVKRREITGQLGSPDDAMAWARAYQESLRPVGPPEAVD